LKTGSEQRRVADDPRQVEARQAVVGAERDEPCAAECEGERRGDDRAARDQPAAVGEGEHPARISGRGRLNPV
jgi:hypothetical protein